MVGIELREDLVTRIQFCRKLGNKRGEEAITILFLDITKIEIIVGHRGQSTCTHALYVLNDRGTKRKFN
jgi:hypothetical protein